MSVGVPIGWGWGGGWGGYLARQVQSGGLGEGAVDLSQHLTQLSHHGPKVLSEGLNGRIEQPTHCLVGVGEAPR